jgi:hypothetical protein
LSQVCIYELLEPFLAPCRMFPPANPSSCRLTSIFLLVFISLYEILMTPALAFTFQRGNKLMKPVHPIFIETVVGKISETLTNEGRPILTSWSARLSLIGNSRSPLLGLLLLVTAGRKPESRRLLHEIDMAFFIYIRRPVLWVKSMEQRSASLPCAGY